MHTARRLTWRLSIALVLSFGGAGADCVVAQRATAIRLQPAEAVFDVRDLQFTAITSILELRDGRVLVADRGENRIALVNLSTKESAPVSRAGDGPGEYRGVGSFHPLGGDSSLFVDPMARRWVVFRGAEPVETISADQVVIRNTGLTLAGSDRTGHLLGVIGIVHSTPLPPMRENADTLGLVLGRLGSSTVDTIARIAGRGGAGLCITVRGTSSRRPPPTCNPLATEDLALLFPDGWTAVARVEPYRVEWRDPGGEWLRGPKLPPAVESISADDRCAFVNARSGLGMARGCDLNRYVWPDNLPPFQSYTYRGSDALLSPSMLGSPDGRLVIRRLMKPSSTHSEYDVVDRQGKLVGVITLPRNETIVGFGVRSVYVAEVTGTGLQQLRRHPWP